ncbi:hypothetical protein, partial [Pseudobutyrivibrio sp.]
MFTRKGKTNGILSDARLSRRPSGLRKTRPDNNSLAHRTTWLRSDFISRLEQTNEVVDNFSSEPANCMMYMITGVRG